MASETTTTGQPLLKRIYDDYGQKQLYPESTFFGAVNKNTVFEGDDFAVVPIISTINGSNNFTNALANQSTSTKEQFQITRSSSYVIGTIDNEAIMASASKRGALDSLLKNHTDLALAEWSRRNGIYWNGNGGGALAQVSTTVAPAGSTITLENRLDAVYFEDKMFLEGSNDDGTGGGGVFAAEVVQLSGVDVDAGTLTVVGTLAANMPSLGVGDFLFRQGDYNNVIAGALSWVTVSSTPGTLFGVNRNNFPSKLAGIRYTGGAGGPIETNIIRGAAHGRIHGARMMDTVILNSRRHADLALSLQAKTRYNKATVSGGKIKVNGKVVAKTTVSYDGFTIMSEAGPLFCLADPLWSYDYALITELGSWECRALGGLPHFDKFAGDRYFVDTNTDGKQFRVKSYMNSVNYRPRNSVLCTL